ncbi:MAG: hypothetical protein AMDU1_APLC00017G0060 [Thermoplasmatales archaeon A-plasma]|jgi:uncharacterized protein (DUF302 family)|nr:MAG: hypothetical protein AMDU1_APLC00017G0060 [Thermoplasmatales archaeon A-plasma]
MVNLHKEKSAFSFDETCNRVYEFLKSRNVAVFTTVDHHENAVKVGLNLRPEKVIMFGSPLVGTHLIEENPDIGLELPSKVLVYQENNLVYVVHADYDDLRNEFHLSRSLEFVNKLASLVADLDSYATHP